MRSSLQLCLLGWRSACAFKQQQQLSHDRLVFGHLWRCRCVCSREVVARPSAITQRPQSQQRHWQVCCLTGSSMLPGSMARLGPRGRVQSSMHTVLLLLPQLEHKTHERHLILLQYSQSLNQCNNTVLLLPLLLPPQTGHPSESRRCHLRGQVVPAGAAGEPGATLIHNTASLAAARLCADSTLAGTWACGGSTAFTMLLHNNTG